MNILVISNMYPTPANKIRGLFVHQQVRELVRQGCDVKVVSPVPGTPLLIKHISGKWKRYSEVLERERLDEVEVFHPRYLEFPRTWGIASSGKRMYRGAQRFFKDLVSGFRFDIIHAHVVLPDGHTAMLLSQEFNKPFIVTVHGQDFQHTIYKNEACKETIKKVINCSEITITVSKKLKAIAETELQINPNKISIIPNGINPRNIFDGKAEISDKYKGRTIILSVSHLIETKGIDLNIKALARLKKKFPNLLYLIAGEGVERKSLEELVRDLDVEDNVEFLGELIHHKVMEYMTICDIFSLPSWNEGFGVVYLEAMANGKPAIACKGEGIDGTIRDKETGVLVKPKDVESLVEEIDFLLSNPEEARKIGKRAKRLVLEKYTWEKISRELIRVYKKALGI